MVASNGHVHPANAQESVARAEVAAARDLQRRLADALGASGQLLYDWNIESDEITWSGAPELLLGWPLERMRTFAQFRDLVDPADRPVLDRSLGESLRSLAPLHTEHRVRRADGRSVRLANDGMIIAGAEGAASRLVGFLRDLADADRGRADLQRRIAARTAQLEAAQVELEAFTYSVSHDLRAPLRHIAGFTELLQAQLPDDEIARRYMDTIVSATVRMSDLIDKLLGLSRIDQTTLQWQSIDLGRLVEEVVAELAEHVAAKRVSWKIETLPVVVADRSLLHVALTNLLSNALKFSSRRDVAEIAIEYENDAKEPPMHLVRIRDNGVGFDMRYADKLFGVFQRLHSETEFGGSGVGLAAVRRIVQRHAGRVWAQGEPGVGALFAFTLPIDPA